MNRFNYKHCHVLYCLQWPFGEILTVIYCKDKQIIWTTTINRSMYELTCRKACSAVEQ